MTRNERANFGSKLGVILASAGSAVGLGNIWRFPFETGNHGGAAFILIYLVCVLILGIPIMIAEFLIGRHSRANTAGAYHKLAPGTQWRWVGRMGVLAGFLILGYYSVVAGWTLEFIGEAATNSFAGKSAAEFISSFNGFVSNPWRPIIWLIMFLLATHFIIVKGVEKGIEKSAKIMMPMLFILLIVLAICSISLPGAGAGIEFLLKPDFSKVDGNVFLGAMGQAFFHSASVWDVSVHMLLISETTPTYLKRHSMWQVSIRWLPYLQDLSSSLLHSPSVFSRMQDQACYSSPCPMSFSRHSVIYPGWLLPCRSCSIFCWHSQH